MRSDPKVSIVIPVYNGADYLAEAIDSALAQTYQNIEIVVVNDGSNDGGSTEKVAQSYGDRVRYFSKSNGGVASALNVAVKVMTGEYFSWLSHDDLYTPNKIERQMTLLMTLPNDRAILFSDYSVFSTSLSDQATVRTGAASSDFFRYWLTTESSLHGCTLLIPKIAFEVCGGFNEDLRTTQDYDLWFRMAEKFQFVHSTDVLVRARQHAAQGSVALADVALKECNILLTGFVNCLQPSEIEVATGESLVVSYAAIAASMLHRSFRPPAMAAATLALRNMYDAQVRDSYRALVILVKAAVKHCLNSAGKILIPQKLRGPIRKALGLSGYTGRAVDLKAKFSTVYRKNLFQGRKSRSGEGSDLVQTVVIRSELPKLFEELEVATVIDAPCGDWYWMKGVDLGGIQYIGVDIVEELIRVNQTNFANETTGFCCLNLATEGLPPADLVFSRDCLVHLSFQDAMRIIANFKRSGAKYLLTTTFSGRSTNRDLGAGFWRPLNMQLAPFNFPQPIRLINEQCTEQHGAYSDKCLGLWLLDDITICV